MTSAQVHDPYAGVPLPELAEPGSPAVPLNGMRLNLLTIEPLKEVLGRVRSKPPRRYLVRPIWAQGSYGVLSAQDKAGKTWADLDLAVSVASGTAWMNTWPADTQGPVVLFLGEGGEDKAVRRLEAICRSRGLVLDDLDLHLCFRTPRLSDLAHLAQIEGYIRAASPVLVIVDPLYLAAGGADSKDLFAMGAVLSNLQMLCEPNGVALFVTHHWNKGGVGTGHNRATGVGPGAWGRTNISMSIEAAETDPRTRRTTVTLNLEFQGDEVAEPDTIIRRSVWADDPHDLSSDLNYEVEPVGRSAAEDDRRLRIKALVRERPEITLTDLRTAAGGKTTDTADLIEAMVRSGDLRCAQTGRSKRFTLPNSQGTILDPENAGPHVPHPQPEGNDR